MLTGLSFGEKSRIPLNKNKPNAESVLKQKKAAGRRRSPIFI
jgi:hypothetical protein